MTEINDIANVETTDFPIHRIIETRVRWRQVYEGLQLIESCIEQGILVPPDRPFGGMLGREWQLRLAELPEQLRANLKTRVLPAIRACCRHPSAPHQLREFEKSAVSQITGAITDAARARVQMNKACSSRPSRATQLKALRAAQNLLSGVLMVLDDILAVAGARDGSVK
ncbi:hypothetical protein [Yoonia vestfoldensis]|jgi:hypothetical protein|uniref:Uncharacterized protein n=1 Tax=Yoonia vestfoldensis TaxID=245188 RepID=A0A1Y0EEH8_9RHOB|nr:hypothetical protein [Yoonia vestfoldensis]ARU01682.1 hypothetical protein LOKVESSMR4R_02378 [Yoonia vestfoldensis]